MLITILLMLPVILVLLFVYRMVVVKLQQRAIDSGDYIAILVALSLGFSFLYWAFNHNWVDAGNMWPYVVGAMGAYCFYAFSLAIYLFYRTRRGVNVQS